MNCDVCINARRVVSENGYHSVCCLSECKMRECLYNNMKHFYPSPMLIEAVVKGKNDVE